MLLRWQALGFRRFSTVKKKNAITALASDGAGALQELVNSRNNREAVLITRGKKTGRASSSSLTWSISPRSDISLNISLSSVPLSPPQLSWTWLLSAPEMSETFSSRLRTPWAAQSESSQSTSNDKGERHTNYLIIKLFQLYWIYPFHHVTTGEEKTVS